MFITDVLCDRPVSSEENSKIKGKDLQEAFNLAQETESFKKLWDKEVKHCDECQHRSGGDS